MYPGGVLGNGGGGNRGGGSVGGRINVQNETPDVLLAFKSTKKFPNPLSITNREDDMGGATFTYELREHMMYCVVVLRIKDDAALEILGETVRRTQNTEEDTEEARIYLYIYLKSMNWLNMWSVLCACTCWGRGGGWSAKLQLGIYVTQLERKEGVHLSLGDSFGCF